MLRYADRTARQVPLLELIVVVLFGFVGPISASTTDSSDSFDTVGYLQAVDPQHNRVILQHGVATYVIDTTHAVIHVPALGSSAAETGDLVVGMRVEVIGASTEHSAIRGNRIVVLPYIAPAQSAAPVIRQSISPVTILGTYDSIDANGEHMVLRVNGHAQIVRLMETTHLLSSSGTPLKLSDLGDGDTVQVTGVQGDNSEIDAVSVTLTALNSDSPSEVLTAQSSLDTIDGVVSDGPSMFSRDIKVRTQSGDIRVLVPHGAEILINGQPSSVHDLKKDMPIQVIGILDSDGSVQAQRLVSGHATDIGD